MAIRLYDLDDTAIRLWIEIKVDKDCDDDDEQIFDEDETQEEAHISNNSSVSLFTKYTNL